MRYFSGPSNALKQSSCTNLFGRNQAFTKSYKVPQRQVLSSNSVRVGNCPGSAASLVEYCSNEDWKSELPRHESSQGAAVALGKFDAMHTGHRELAAEATKLGGHPWLLSFSGMAEVLGWPERPPLVAESDRPRVLTSWAPYCEGVLPCQRLIPFAAVRQLSPEDFVRALALNMKVCGVVVGKGFRFGYKAAGDTEALLSLGAKYNLDVSVVDLVERDAMHGSEKVSSSSVRSALAEGQVERVRDLLGRRHRLVIQPAAGKAAASQPERCTFVRDDFQNQPPKGGDYIADVRFIGNGSKRGQSRCQVIVDEEGILIQAHCPPATTSVDALTEVHVDF
ncbi:hypothetical protein WJX75_001070 [Coccomyxa subellipsoidea]|uniref:FAD synthase n=1 Tax=Coccomyxa subellipsoidea TaxID=248742 RepID=A0ABR2YXC9_9CHLO